VNEIRKVRLSRMLCDNSDDIETIQVYAMVLPDHEMSVFLFLNHEHNYLIFVLFSFFSAILALLARVQFWAA
jgi:hypothetical protein